MKLLVDSHVAIWWLEDPTRLKPRVRTLLQDPNNSAFFSAASVWEISIKKAKGKLNLPDEFVDLLIEDGFEEIGISAKHGILASKLPPIHQDPFDRMLVAQSLAEDFVLA